MTHEDWEKFGNEKALVTVSGGVDSSVSALLTEKHLVNYELVFVDTGFLRQNEADAVRTIFGDKVQVLDAKSSFSLCSEAKTSHEKRATFRKAYFDFIKTYAIKNGFSAIVQGTQFYSNQSKRYHNLPPEDFWNKGLKVIEPVKGWSKKQIRQMAQSLGLPEEFANRRPFPGPGLLIRFGGQYSDEKLNLVRRATRIVDEFVGRHKEEFSECYQIFPYLTEELATYVDAGMQGGLGRVLLIRAVYDKNHEDKYLPFRATPKLEQELVSSLMSVGGIGRVCFDATPKVGFGEKVSFGGTIEYQ
ncbi:MAG: phosphoadenosine phosphosulfate reductase family protein [Candidatus Nomurabacteria bacterium]|jgi:GMP synthase (glutamine-hydrolysing)|nr:phosphoadenosine phosphosulfate reductase family protein [Candidatus Nomurabacteria bacterium]